MIRAMHYLYRLERNSVSNSPTSNGRQKLLMLLWTMSDYPLTGGLCAVFRPPVRLHLFHSRAQLPFNQMTG